MQNLTRNHNLKQNVFDRMLSDEMLSIKNYMHEKDMTYTPTLQDLPKIYVATPTLVLKQNWRLEKKPTVEEHATTLSSNAITTQKEVNKGTTTEINDDEHYVGFNVEKTRQQQKVLGLRSLSHSQSRVPNMRKDTYLRDGKICTCTVTNPPTSCSHVCTGPSSSHSASCSRKHPISIVHSCYTPPSIHPLVLETSASFVATPPPAYPFQYLPNYYIHMSVPSDSYDYETTARKRKHKHRKKTKDKYLYYDDLKSPTNKKYDEYYIEEYTEEPIKNFKEDKGKITLNMGQIAEKHDTGLGSLFHDIRKYFSEDVLKDCSSSQNSAAVVGRATGNVYLLIIIQLIFNRCYTLTLHT